MTRKRQSLPDGPLYDPRGRGAAEVATLSWEYACGHHVPEHFHDEDQLVYAARGMMTVRAPGGLWFVPPRRAVWIPAKVAHAIDMTASVSMKTLYMEPRLVKALPRECRVVHVSALLHELVLRACAMGKLRRAMPKEAHVTALLVDELEAAPSLPAQIPGLRDPRALRIEGALMANPADKRSLAELCRHVGASKRTIERIFQSETGMTFGKWRQQLSLVHGMRLLASGTKVTAAAIDVGYDSPSAFIAMFRRALGTTPMQWLEDARDEVGHAGRVAVRPAGAGNRCA
jgi:AraC-like DNA-binding protein